MTQSGIMRRGSLSSKILQRNAKPRRLLSLEASAGLFDLLHEGVALLDAQGTIRMANPALARLLGGAPSEDEFAPSASLALASNALLGENIHRFLAPDEEVNFDALVELLSLGLDRLGPFEMRMAGPDGKPLQVRATLARLESNGQVLASLLVQDVGEWNEIHTTLDLQRFEIEQSYSATLEGWAKALELRHLESYGHTRRVVPATVLLAEMAGVGADEMMHIRHGATLHDIGKLSIPDSILLKPGKLNAEEWVEMRKHPEYARQLLERIDYLRPAMDIPCAHHEKWNGSGYPNNLRGADIPLAARIFALIDVTEALLDKRFYRGFAWSPPDVHAYIEVQAGVHFDPDLAVLFLQSFEQFVLLLKKND